MITVFGAMHRTVWNNHITVLSGVIPLLVHVIPVQIATILFMYRSQKYKLYNV